jgi:hypothetical protein
MRTAHSGAKLAARDSAADMRVFHPHISMIVACLVIATSHAEAQAPPPKPYATVAITRPAASDDASFVAFRTALAAVAKSRIYVELAALVLKQGFFWDRDFGQRFDPRRPAVDNLAVAIGLERGDGIGWIALAKSAADPAVEPLDSRPGVICAPARPDYDGIAFAKLLDTTYTGSIDWAYPRADSTEVRAAPRPDAGMAGTLGLHFVRLLGFEGASDEPFPGRVQWARVVLPDGKTGYVAPNSLMSLTAARLCYIKDQVDGWRIAGTIAGGN